MTKLKRISAARAYSEVARSAEKIRNAEPATIEVMDLGDVVRQGDLYLIRLSGRLEPSPERWPAGRQLAIGLTQGSRHVAEGERCEVYAPDHESAGQALANLLPATGPQRQFFGPAIHAERAVTITHPEHGHRTLPAGDYLVTYQRVWANEVRRVAD